MENSRFTTEDHLIPVLPYMPAAEEQHGGKHVTWDVWRRSSCLECSRHWQCLGRPPQVVPELNRNRAAGDQMISVFYLLPTEIIYRTIRDVFSQQVFSAPKATFD